MQISFITRQRIILIGILVFIFLVMFIRHRIRYIVIIPLSIIAIFTLATIIFPLYEQAPNFATFYQMQPSTLYFTTTNTTSKITIQNKTTKKELNGKTTTQLSLPKNLDTTISFVSSSTTGDETCNILLPEGTNIQLAPQTQITFFSQYPKLVIEEKVGQATAISSDNYSPRQLTLSGITTQAAGKNQFQQLFETKKIATIGKQASKIFMENATLKKINVRILEVLARLQPAKYQKYIDNFKAFENYVPTQVTRIIDKVNDPNITQDIGNQAQKGFQETEIYKRWKNLFK